MQSETYSAGRKPVRPQINIYDYIIRKGNDASGVNQEEGVEIATA